MALPDFLIVGAMKCGTSTLQAQLAAQPGVFMTDPKEPNFFSDDEIHARGLAWYESLFDAAAPGDLKGEASTHYTKLPTYPDTVARMQTVLDAPRFIYLVRDPMERAVSQYLHEWSVGAVGDDMASAFEARPDFVSYSLYAMQLAPYVAHYGKEAVLVVQAERIKADPQRVLDRVGSFLGRGGLVWQDDLGAQNASAERSRPLPMHGLLVDNPVATALRHALVPKALRTRIRRSRMPRGRPALPPELTQRLRPLFEEDVAALDALVPADQIVR
jgi:hypothetical protein